MKPTERHPWGVMLREQRGFLLFLLLMGLFRTAVADWNPVPSGSMRPTIQEGDVVLVNRLAYDLKWPLTDVVLISLAEPQRGEIVTFTSPRDGVRLIKRLVAVGGDVVTLREGRLSINGEPAHYEGLRLQVDAVGRDHEAQALRGQERVGEHTHAVQWYPAVETSRDFGPYTVPEGHFFMMGDNRDNSADSRMIGPIPRHRLIGRAHRILVSADILGHWAPQWDRFGQALQ